MPQAATGGRGFFASLRGWLHLPGGRVSMEDRVRDIVVRSRERPMPSACPRCGGELRTLAPASHSVPQKDMKHQRTFCSACGVEEEWHQLIRTVGR